MPTARKAEIVSDLTEKMSRVQLAVVSDYRGLTVAEMNELREKLRENGAEFIVAKNTLLRIAARETGNEALEPFLQGPTAITFGYDDVAKVAKVLTDHVRSAPKPVVIRGGILGKTSLTAEGLTDVTKLPSREEVLGQILGGISSPLSGLVGVLNAPATDLFGVINATVSSLSYVLQARADQLQAEGDGSPAA